MRRSISSVLPFVFVATALGGDFDGDGFDDILVGAPSATVFVLNDGAYYVLRGGAAGIDGTSGVEQGVNTGDADPAVASVLAIGDFDGDGFSDAAIAAPAASVDGVEGAGRVLVRYGTGAGGIFDATRDFTLHQNVLGVASDAAVNIDSPMAEGFGRQIVAGDFDGNKCSDLAIGVWDEIDGQPRAGAVHVFYGKKKVGLTVKKSQYWHQNSKGIASIALDSEAFGARLCVGDFNGDKKDDLVCMSKDHDDVPTRAALTVLFGSKRGLTAKKSRRIDDVALGLPQPSLPWMKSFADGLAAGDFNGDGKDELVVGLPGEDIDGVNAGTFHLLPGSKKGPEPLLQLVYSQATPGVPGTAEIDRFATTLAAGDFNGDGIADLAIGITSDGDIEDPDSGAVAILFGNTIGLIGAGSQFLHQNILGFGQVETDDAFGYALTTGDFNGDGFGDIAIGVPGEDLGAFTECGMVDVFYGTATGFPSLPAEHHYRGDGEIPGPTASSDAFGSSLGS